MFCCAAKDTTVLMTNKTYFKCTRNASLIFAWIGAILSGLGASGSFALNMIWAVFLCFSNRADNIKDGVNVFVASSALFAYFGTGFIASILLLVGIIKRIPILIKGYIAYGVALAIVNALLISAHDSATEVNKACRIAEISGNTIFFCILHIHYCTLKGTVITLESEKNTNGKVAPPKEAHEEI